jgi:formate hydrogenlyase transcriptional activator
MTDLKPSLTSSPKPAEKLLARESARHIVRSLDRDQVVEALRNSAGRVGGADGAAARLGLKRTTLLAHMKRLGIDPRSVGDLS